MEKDHITLDYSGLGRQGKKFAQLAVSVQQTKLRQPTGLKIRNRTSYIPKNKIMFLIIQITGEPLIRRADDNPETLRKRLATYHEQTSPLVNFYSKRRLLCSVDASLDSTTIFEKINKIFVHMKSKYIKWISENRITGTISCSYKGRVIQ